MSLQRLYEEVDRAVHAFAAARGLGCPHGCGICCEGFIPEIRPVESHLLAVHLMSVDRGEEGRLLFETLSSYEGRGCPLYRSDTPYHCSVYPVRPLVCRLFAYSSTRDKNGALRFRLCRHMPAPLSAGTRRDWEEHELERPGRSPAMENYQRRLEAIDHSPAEPLPGAVVAAMGRFLLQRQLASAEILGQRGRRGRSISERGGARTG